MIGEVIYKADGQPLLPVSLYQPPKPVADLTMRIKQDYSTGYNILHEVFEEFNNMSLVDRINKDQKLFNVYVPEKSTDPQEEWRWNGVRPTTRNKIISIVAHLTSQIIYPNVFAQNTDDDEDKLAATTMRDLIEWHIRNSDYELSFLYGVLAACVNPVAYLQVEFVEIMQEVKKKYEDGKISKEQVIDEVLSGLQVYNVPADEILISNPYQFYIQKQRFIIRRKTSSFDEVEARYKGHKNWEYVQPGIKVLYSEADGLFYEAEDPDLQDQVEKVVYYNRLEDLEICFINGIYFGDENVEANRIKHRDTQDRPKYPYAKYGYEPIDAKRFYFYKSGVHKLASDQELIDKMWRLLVDASTLAVMKPIISSGEDFIDKSVIFPAGVTNVSADTKVMPLDIQSDFQAGMNILTSLEQSISASSQDEIRQGMSSDQSRTAFEISRIEQNAIIQLGMFGKIIAKAVKDIGELMIDLIVNHQTIGELEELTDGQTAMKYKTFLLPEQSIEGNKKTKKIRFTDKYLGKSMTEEQKLKQSYKIMKEQGGKDSDLKLIEVNPEYFAKLSFKIIISADSLLPKNKQFEKMMKLDAYDRMIANPMVDPESVTRDFLVEPLAEGKSDKYMAKKEDVERMLGMQQQAKQNQRGKQGNNVQQLAENGTMAGALSS